MDSPRWTTDPPLEDINKQAQYFYKLVKEKFNILIEKYGFKLEFEKTMKKVDDDASIVFQSGKGRIRFIWSRTSGVYVALALGTSTFSDCGTTVEEEWIYINNISKFLNIEFNGDVINIQRDNPTYYEQQIYWWMNFLSPHWEKIISLFDSPSFAKKYKIYKKYMSREIKNLNLTRDEKKFKSILERGIVTFLLIASFFVGLLLLANTSKTIPFNSEWLIVVTPTLAVILLLYLFHYLQHKSPFR